MPLIRPEAMYAQIPLEMLESGDWLTPRLNSARYFDKPPLFYWINLIAYQIGGISDNSVRLATFGIGLGEVLATLVLGMLLFSRLTGWLAGLILLTCIGFFALHVQMLVDHLITLTLSWSIYFLWQWRRQQTTMSMAGFYLCLGLGVMSKGMIGFFFPLAIGGLFSLWTRDARFWRFFLNPYAWIALLAALLPWFGLMELHNPGFLKFHLVNEQINRFLGHRYPPDIRSFSLPGFWLFTLVWLMPWTPFLPAALSALRPKHWLLPEPKDAPVHTALPLGWSDPVFFQPFFFPDRILQPSSSAAAGPDHRSTPGDVSGPTGVSSYPVEPEPLCHFNSRPALFGCPIWKRPVSTIVENL